MNNANTTTPPVDPQGSEIHDTTADASTAPDAGLEPAGGSAQAALPHPNLPAVDVEKIPLQPLPPDTVILRDDTDVGGPLVILSSDPALNPPQVPQDPFPTEGKPEIDAAE